MKRLGKYRLLEPLASGGMAEVWRASLTGPGGFEKEVALKLVRADLATQPELARLFVQEARLASRLGHANVVQIFEFDEVEGRPCLAMELVRGRTLRQVVERCRETGRRLGLARSVHVAAEVARALAYAHRLSEGGVPLGIVHRDVSPQNVLLSFEGEVKLADFGIARALGAVEQTAPGTVKGKLAYMAPEQARGEPVDGRADLFALGVVLWELCAGRRLFARDSEAATLQALLSEPISPPSEWNEAVPADLDAAVARALERDRERRVASADELLAALAALRLRLARSPEELDLRPLMRELWPEAASPPAAPPEPTRIRPAPEPAAEPGEAPTRTVPAPRRPRAWAVVAGLGILAAAGAWRAVETVRRDAALREGGGLAAARGSWSPTTSTPNSAPTPTAPPTSPTPASAAASPREPRVSTAPAPLPLPRSGGGEGQGEGGTASSAPPWPSGPIGSLPLPPRQSGEGILAVNANPWATVHVGAVRAGDTPREWRLPAGRYRLRASHPARGGAEGEIEVRAGERCTWQPRLAR